MPLQRDARDFEIGSKSSLAEWFVLGLNRFGQAVHVLLDLLIREVCLAPG
jgi:hypothetical protein